MLKTERMKQVVVAGSKRQLEDVIGILQKLRVLHIEEHEPDDFFTYGDPLPEGERVAETRLTARGLIKSLGLEQIAAPPALSRDRIDNWSQAVRAVEEIDDAVTDLVEKREQTRTRLRETQAHAARLQRLAPLGLRLEHLAGYRHLSLLLGTTSEDPEPLLLKHLGDHQLHKSPEEGGYLVALFVRAREQKEAENLLAQVGFSELEAPEGEGSVEHAAGEALIQARRTQSELEDLEHRIESARKTHGARLLAAERVLAVAAERANAPLRFATSKHGFVITGFVPTRRTQEVEKALMAATDHSIHVDWHDPGPAERHGAPHNADQTHGAHDEPTQTPPAALPPSKFAHKRKGPASFTQMLTLHSWPKYKEIDPTVLIYITFPLFFAVMIGDLAFGILIMLVAAYLYRNHIFGIGGPRVGRMLMLAGFWTAVFGVFLYGEAFGFHFVESPGHLSWEYVLGMDWHNYYVGHGEIVHLGFHIGDTTIQLGYLSKLHNVVELLAISFALAVVHLNLALFLGIYNQWILHGPKHAILARVSWLVMELGIIGLAVGGYVGDRNIMLAGGAVLALAILMIIAGEGIVGALELPKLVSNAASYFRLAAVAMSKAGMALAVNSFAFVAVTPTAYHVAGVGGWVLLIVGHLIILALGIIAGGLHSMRLQLVEFFGWFFEGGGRPFKAFGDPHNLP